MRIRRINRTTPECLAPTGPITPARSSVDEISITIAFALLGLTWLTLRGMDGRERRRHRR